MASRRKMSAPTDIPLEALTALYIRVSTDFQFEEGYSVEAQKEMLAAYCTTYRFPNHEFYIDGAYSGSNMDRPELHRLIEDVRRGRVKRVIVYKLDRLSRSQKDTLYLIEDVFNAYGAAFLSVKEQLDTHSSTGRLMIGILASFAQLERDNIRERTSMGMRKRVQSGLWPGGARTPLGYDYDPARDTLVPNQQADTVRKCFSLFLAGQSPDAIARTLGFKYDNAVRGILSRRTYVGEIEYGGQVYAGKHEPLIDRETFERAQRLLIERSGRHLTGEARYLLTGLLVCGYCGASMRYQKWGKAGVRVYCYSRQTSKRYLVRDESCPAPLYWAEDIERQVIALMKQRPIERAETPPRAHTSPLELTREELAAEKKALSRLYGLYADGDETLMEVIARKRERIEKLARQLEAQEAAERSGTASQKRREKIHRLMDVWDELPHATRRAIALEWIDRVVVKGGEIDVYFKF